MLLPTSKYSSNQAENFAKTVKFGHRRTELHPSHRIGRAVGTNLPESVKMSKLFTVLFALLLVVVTHADGIKRMDCDAFCKKTGFRFNAGVCKCGYMLFANKRSV